MLPNCLFVLRDCSRGVSLLYATDFAQFGSVLAELGRFFPDVVGLRGKARGRPNLSCGCGDGDH